MNIWLISKYATAAKYGFETRLFALAREFKKAGRHPVIISSDSNHLAAFPVFDSVYAHEIIDGCEVWWIRTLRYRASVSLKRVLSWLDFELKLLFMPKRKLPKPDLIIVSSLSLLTILNGLLLRRRYKCKLIFEVRDIWPLTMIEEGGYSRRNPFVKLLAWIERLGYRKSDMVVGTMPNLAEHVSNVAGDGLVCECVPFGFDSSFFNEEEPAPSDYIRQYIPENKFIIGYAGSIGISNALETIVACAREMADDDRFFFLFVGDGGMRDKYISETKDLKNVAFAPKVKRTQVQSLLRRCDVLYFAVYDSMVWRYGLSLNKLIDYMMAAKPVIASYSGFPSMLNESGSGVFVPAGDLPALKGTFHEFIEKSPEELSAVGLTGRKWLIANRRWDVIARHYLNLCDTLQ